MLKRRDRLPYCSRTVTLSVAPAASIRHACRVVDVMALLAERGVLLESARGPIPNVAELIAGEPISGSWWAHPASHAIFGAINDVADSPDADGIHLTRPADVTQTGFLTPQNLQYGYTMRNLITLQALDVIIHQLLN